MAKVVSVNISEKKGTLKRAVPEIELKLRHGIVGDAHAGDWHRQISLLAEESIDTMRPRSPIALDPGVFAENINTEGIDLSFHLSDDPCMVEIRAAVTCTGVTGVEMEALTAVSVAALTVYDMCKAVQKDMEITNIRLLEKSGGKSGDYKRED